MKRIIWSILGLAVLFTALYFVQDYVTDKKIDNIVMTTALTKEGKPVDETTTFTTADRIYVAAKQNRFWTKEARIVLYKNKITSANRIDVQKNVAVNDGGYFTATFDDLAPGKYGVTIYVEGNNIIETSTMFTVQ